MKKLHFIYLITLVLLTVLLLPLSVHALSIPGDVDYILIDAKTGQVLAQQGADQRVHPASTTKIMTAVIALDSGAKLDQQMNVSLSAVNDIGRGGSNVGIMAGEQGLTLENMLNVLLIKSANESANIIAENLAPSRQAFVDLMNKKAAALGCKNTTFVNPCGKDDASEDADHLTTPRDLAMITRYAMTLPKFREIVSTEYYKNMPVTDKHDDWGILRNTNQFLWDNNAYAYTLNGTDHKFTVNGVKTGYTVAAGNNLVTSAVGEDGMEVISVVMHVNGPNRIYGYAKELLRYGFEHYSLQKIAESGQIITSVNVDGAKENNASVGLITASDLSVAVPIGGTAQSVQQKINVTQSVTAPVQQGARLGTVEYSLGGNVLGSVDLIAVRAIEQAPKSFLDKLTGKSQQSQRTKPAQQSGDSHYSYAVLIILVILSALAVLRLRLKSLSEKRRRARLAQPLGDDRNLP